MKSVSVKILLLLFKIALMMVSLVIIYNRVIEKENLENFLTDTQLLKQNNSILLLIIIVVLMIFNWLIEATKWQYLINRIHSITLTTAWSAILSGVTISFFTPNRMGEFAGRVLHLPEGIRLKATLITFIGNTAQAICTIVFGTTAFLFCIPLFIELDFIQLLLVIFIVTILNISMVFFYFKISLLNKWLQKIKWVQRYATQTAAFSAYSKQELASVLFLSALRYFIFTTQFVLMLFLFDNSINVYTMYAAVAIVFLMITVVPTIALTELPIRGSIAVFVIGLFGSSSLHILEASFLIWLVNLVLPAIAGSFTLLTLKLSKQA